VRAPLGTPGLALVLIEEFCAFPLLGFDGYLSLAEATC